MPNFRGLLVCLLLMTGCAKPVQTYFDHERPANPAYVEDYVPAYCGQINRFTAEPARQFLGGPRQAEKYEIVPGQTDLLVVYARNDTFSKIDSNAKAVRFMAEPGHTYRLDPEADFKLGFRTLADNEWDVRVIDKTTDKVVAETHDREQAKSASNSNR